MAKREVTVIVTGSNESTRHVAIDLDEVKRLAKESNLPTWAVEHIIATRGFRLSSFESGKSEKPPRTGGK